MATTRMYLTGTIPGLERHFTVEALDELNVLIHDLRRGVSTPTKKTRSRRATSTMPSGQP